MQYEYVPITHRERLRWPDDRSVAVIITLNLETWDLVKDSDRTTYAGGPSILPHLLPSNVPDFPNYTWREYGQRVGVWRLFELFEELGIPVSCTVNGATCLRRRAMVDHAVARGWEIVAHNYEQAELLTDYAHDRDAERAVIRKTLAAYREVVGRDAKGWLSSSLRGTLNTASILAEEGLLFYCDLMNDDQPYMLQTDHGEIVIVPYSNEINDFTLFTRQGHTPNAFRDILIEELNTLRKEGKRQARLMNVGLHPHVAGRAYRIRALREFLEYARSLDDVWWPTREEVANWYLNTRKKS
ncbi:MAG: polysaccharide deacetylase [Gammaproteobacteria bacterium]|nr:polysaccharide deacetylase [Gammaproteobacteria bacterium]